MLSVLYQDKHGCTENYCILTYSMSSVLYQDKHGCTEDYVIVIKHLRVNYVVYKIQGAWSIVTEA